MDQNNNNNGLLSLFVSIFTGFISWFNFNNVSEALRTISVCVSIAAGIMAIRYYYYSIKKIKP